MSITKIKRPVKEEIEPQKNDIYDLDYREEMVDNDEISSREQAFMQGYDEAANE